MSLQFLVQPHAEFRLGDFLTRGLVDPKWTAFRAAVAFVKQSGTKHIRESLAEFSARGGFATISAGIDSGVTSAEGLSDLVIGTRPNGRLFVFHNANSSTFHPKVYLFRNAVNAEVLVGSGNLTEGGLFTNYEAGLVAQLDLAIDAHRTLLEQIERALDTWSTPAYGLCYAADEMLIRRLVESGELPDEAHTRTVEDKSGRAVADGQGNIESLFRRFAVPSAPKVSLPDRAQVASSTGEGEEESSPDDEAATLEVPAAAPVPPQTGTNRVFLMSLQRTDVGVGQTTRGTQRRSPEIFIPLIARNFDAEFWGWPTSFQPDPAWTGPVDGDGRGKMDRPNVMIRLGGETFPASIWYNPDKRDMRIRSEHIRSAGAIGDLLYMERADGTGGFSYYVDVIPAGSARFAELSKHCTNAVRNSRKAWGYF
jgi:hypothetical protein